MTREIFTYYVVCENGDKTEGRGPTIQTIRTRDRARAVQAARGEVSNVEAEWLLSILARTPVQYERAASSGFRRRG